MIRTTLRKENIRQRNFKKHFKFQNTSEIFYCDMTILRNKNLSECFYKISIHKNHFKKHWDRIWDRTCLRNIQYFKHFMKYYTVE